MFILNENLKQLNDIIFMVSFYIYKQIIKTSSNSTDSSNKASHYYDAKKFLGTHHKACMYWYLPAFVDRNVWCKQMNLIYIWDNKLVQR